MRTIGYAIQVKRQNGFDDWDWWDGDSFEYYEYYEAAKVALREHSLDAPDAELRLVEVREVLE